MDYEKKYNDLVNDLKELWNCHTNDDQLLGELAEICPELEENEDERIRKGLIEALKTPKTVGELKFILPEPTREECIAYLEKQKEQKPHLELKAGKWYICHRAFCARADHLTVKEGERFQCEKDGIVKGFVIKEPEKYFKECGAPAPMEDEQKEQKPVDMKVKYVYPKFRIGDIISNNKPEPGFINDYTIVGFNNELPDYLVDDGNVPSCSIGIEFIDSNYHLKEQKPVDLSEMMVHKEPYIAPVPTPMVADEQKPAEWSEEDEKMRNLIAAIFEVNHPDGFFKVNELGTTDMRGVHTEEIISWLKSLRPVSKESLQPPWKPSEEDEKKMIFLERLIEYNVPDGQYGWADGRKGGFVTKSEAISMLKSLRPVSKESLQSHWKPSEEQMEALEKTTRLANFGSDAKRRNALLSLYEQLTKL